MVAMAVSVKKETIGGGGGGIGTRDKDGGAHTITYIIGLPPLG